MNSFQLLSPSVCLAFLKEEENWWAVTVFPLGVVQSYGHRPNVAFEHLKCSHSNLRWALSIKYTPDF